VAESDATGGGRGTTDSDERDDIDASQTTPKPRRTGLANTPTMTRPSTPIPSAQAVRFMLALQEGSPVGEYEIQSQIGEGAMGTVYSAVQPLIGKTVAIKVLKPELCSNQASVDRFVQEAQAVNRIGHPNIVDVFSLGELPDGRAYFVMEWLRGEDLKVRLAKEPISVDDTCEILGSIARALEAAHAKDIVHRDLKPDNVFLHRVDNGPVMVKLLDFGIAKLMREKASMDRTATGNMLGTPRYISPEQARGVDVTHRSDIYSLGVMAYEMLAGRPPFTGETGMDLVVKHLNEPPPPLSAFARVPKSLERCVMSMLAKDPADRPTLAAVRRCLADPYVRTSASDMPRLRGRSSRKWIVPAVLAALVVAGGAFAAVKLMGGDAEPAAITASVPPPKTVIDEPPKQAPKPEAKPAGTLAVTIDGAKDAMIFVDGEELGLGNQTQVKMLDPGDHEVVAKLKGKEVAKQMVTIVANNVNNVSLAVPKPIAQRPVVRPVIRKPPAKPQQPAGDGDLLTPKGMRK
jgi:serine/threonine protein kinase